MGIGAGKVEFLAAAARNGVDFSRTLTLGRQELFATAAEVDDILARQGITKVGATECAFAEPLFELLGATKVDSLDVSAYQDATIVHDLNQPVTIPDRFTAVIDVGTIEHVYDVATCLQNCGRLVAVGGHLLFATPANNQLGHGFYQFSPELFYRAFSRARGFEVRAMFLRDRRWRLIRDPAEVGERVAPRSRSAATLFVVVRKVAEVDNARVPQQSDYEPVWAGSQGPSRAMALAGHIPPRLRRRLHQFVYPVLEWRSGRRTARSADMRTVTW